jgi:hypothetical protein
LIESGLHHVVAETGVAKIIAAPNAEASLAHEVARSVAQAIQAGEPSPHAQSRARIE